MKREIKTTDAIFPMPVLMIATYNEDGSVNVMNAAWGMMLDREHIVLGLTESHKTVTNMKARHAFTVSLADSKHVVEADYFGIVSGNNEPRKLEKAGLTATRAENVDAPIINEFPVCMECEFIEYQNGLHGCGVVGKIHHVVAEESVISGDTVDVSLLDAIAYDSFTHGYYKIGERVGNAFKDGLAIKNKNN